MHVKLIIKLRLAIHRSLLFALAKFMSSLVHKLYYNNNTPMTGSIVMKIETVSAVDGDADDVNDVGL